MVVLIIVQLAAKDGAADGTTLGFAALVLVLVFALIAPRQTGDVVRRVTTFKVAGIEVGLAEIKRAERVRPLPAEDDGVDVVEKRPVEGDPLTQHEAVAERLRGRLRFIWDFLSLHDHADIKRKTDYEAILNAVRQWGLLTWDEETFIRDMLDGGPADFSDWPTRVRDDFLDTAWEFATRLGPLVWARHVRRELERRGWFVAEFKQQRGHRPDFLAAKDGRWALVAARVAGTEQQPHSLNASKKRLAGFESEAPISGRRLVIPDIRHSTPASEPVRVVHLSELLDDPEAAFD